MVCCIVLLLAFDKLSHFLKIFLITYKALNNLAPSCIRDLLTSLTPSRQLRSLSKHLLFTPSFNLKRYGPISFSVPAPTLWDAVPYHIRNSSSVALFKNRLNLFLMRALFISNIILMNENVDENDRFARSLPNLVYSCRYVLANYLTILSNELST